MLIITDPDAGSYCGYQIEGLESKEETTQARAEHVAKLDEVLGIVDASVECSCMMSIAGDHVSFSSCSRHGLEDETFPECCYCSDPSKCRCFEEMTDKHIAYAKYCDD